MIGHVDLEGYLRREGVWYRILNKPPTIHTADASKVTGVSLEHITKSLVFKADGEPVLGVIPGDRKVDLAKLATAVGAQRVELVTFEEAERFSGYPPGGTPPVHHTNIVKVVFDAELMRFNTIYGGGGSRDKLLELRVQDVLKLSGGIVADISKPS
jgi:Cys-tRNA(Pro)/Cys-tRNA(Cys) deacylase